MKPKILCITDLTLAPEAIEIMEQVADVTYLPNAKDRVADIIGDYDAFWGHIDFKIDKQLLEKATRLKSISSAATGTDHIDKKAAAERGIKILSIAQDYKLLDTFTATAECAWMLLLNSFRMFRAASASVFLGQWDNSPFFGEQLLGSTLGVLGVGRLGKMMVRYANAFGMRVLGCDLKPINIDGVEQVDFETLLAQSDAISIHIHMEESNYHLFDANTFAKMRDGAVLINTSRGDIIDEVALIEALDSGKLSAFGADVIHNEWMEDIRDSILVRYAQDHPNVIITPHLGGATTKSIRDARVFSAQKLVHFLQTGEELVM